MCFGLTRSILIARAETSNINLAYHMVRTLYILTKMANWKENGFYRKAILTVFGATLCQTYLNSCTDAILTGDISFG